MSSAGKEVQIALRVQPKASRNRLEVDDTHHGRAWVTAPPEDGKANKALQALVAKELGVAKRDVRIVSGVHSRNKILAVRGL